MSECEPLSRPTWALGVIRVTGALNSCWKSCNRLTSSTDFSILTFITELTVSRAAGLVRFGPHFNARFSRPLRLLQPDLNFKNVQIHTFHHARFAILHFNFTLQLAVTPLIHYPS